LHDGVTEDKTRWFMGMVFRKPVLADAGSIKCSGRGKGMPGKKPLLNFLPKREQLKYPPFSKGG